MYGFGEIAERLRRSTVQVFDGESARGRKARGGGSGVIWRADGAVLTNAHVARSDAAEVELWDGRRFGSSRRLARWPPRSGAAANRWRGLRARAARQFERGAGG